MGLNLFWRATTFARRKKQFAMKLWVAKHHITQFSLPPSWLQLECRPWSVKFLPGTMDRPLVLFLGSQKAQVSGLSFDESCKPILPMPGNGDSCLCPHFSRSNFTRRNTGKDLLRWRFHAVGRGRWKKLHQQPQRGPCKVIFRIPYSPFEPRHTSVLPAEAMAYFRTGFFTTSYFRTVFFVLGILSFCKQDPSRFLVPVQVPRAYFLTLFEGRVVQPHRCQPPLHSHVDLLFFSGRGTAHWLLIDRPASTPSLTTCAGQNKETSLACHDRMHRVNEGSPGSHSECLPFVQLRLPSKGSLSSLFFFFFWSRKIIMVPLVQTSYKKQYSAFRNFFPKLCLILRCPGTLFTSHETPLFLF